MVPPSEATRRSNLTPCTRSTRPSAPGEWRQIEPATSILRTTSDFGDYLADPFTEYTPRNPTVDEVDVVVVGGGLAGVITGVKLREAGIERIRFIDKAGGFGGTWYWNRYPGLMCDVESYIYMPMLEEMGSMPTMRYASGEEIRLHLDAIAEKFRLGDGALFHTNVESTTWDDGRSAVGDPHRSRRRDPHEVRRHVRRNPQPPEDASARRD